MGIVLGLCSAQIAGLVTTGKKGEIPNSWRWVGAVSGVVAVIQIVGGIYLESSDGGTIASSRAVNNGDEGEQDDISTELTAESQTPETPLLPASPNKPEQLSLKSILSSPTLRPPALLCATIMAIQQASGVNAVLFYSARILTSVLPASAGVISVGITVVNAIMTFPPIFLVDVSAQVKRSIDQLEIGEEDPADDFHGRHVRAQLCDRFGDRWALADSQRSGCHLVHRVSCSTVSR